MGAHAVVIDRYPHYRPTRKEDKYTPLWSEPFSDSYKSSHLSLVLHEAYCSYHDMRTAELAVDVTFMVRTLADQESS